MCWRQDCVGQEEDDKVVYAAGRGEGEHELGRGEGLKVGLYYKCGDVSGRG